MSAVRYARALGGADLSYNHFSVLGETTEHQILAWRERLGYVVDVLPSRLQIAHGFQGELDRYKVDELVLIDARADPVALERSLARISTDAERYFIFVLVLEGAMGEVACFYQQRSQASGGPGALALDMNQPFRLRRPACRVLNLFVPRSLVETVLPDADAVHGRILDWRSPWTRILYEHMSALTLSLPGMDAAEARAALRQGAHLFLAAFGKQAMLSGDARAALRAAKFGRARRYIQANLHQATLSPETVLDNLQMPRASLYRLFEHEGGIAAYIRDQRLREAANELGRFPHLAVKDIAYGLGFNSPSSFARAFRHAFDMTPQDLRAHILAARQGGRRQYE